MSKRDVWSLPEVWIPCTPGGTDCAWLASATEAQAWQRLLEEASHMPYRGIEGFKARGYTVNRRASSETKGQP